MTDLLLCLLLTQAPSAQVSPSASLGERLEQIDNLEQEAVRMRAVLSEIHDKLRDTTSLEESKALAASLPALDALARDVPSRARIIEEFEPPETAPSGLALDRILADFSHEEAELARLRDRLARGEILSAAEIQRTLRGSSNDTPSSTTDSVGQPENDEASTPPGKERSDDLPHGSPVLHAILELEEHRVVPLRVLWDRKRAEMLAASPAPPNSDQTANNTGLPRNGTLALPPGDTSQAPSNTGRGGVPIHVDSSSLDPLQAAEALYRLRRYDEALEAFAALPKVPPGKEAYILYLRAACHRELGHFSESLDLLAEAATRFPSDEWGLRARKAAPLVRVRKELQKIKTQRALANTGVGGS